MRRFLFVAALLALAQPAVAQQSLTYWRNGETQSSPWVATTPGNPMPVAGPSVGGGFPVTQGTVPWVDNVTQIGGASITLGQKTSAASIPVVLPSDQSVTTKIDQTTPGTTNGVAIVGVNGATALAGAGATGTGSARTTQAQDATTAAGIAPGTVAPGTAPANTVMAGCQYNATLPAATDTQVLAEQCDPGGRLRVNSQPSTQNFVGGTATQTSTTTTSLIALVASNRIYVTSFECYNSGASTSVVLFQDGSGGTTIGSTIVPAGGGSNGNGGGMAMFRTTAGTALFFAPQTASTTVGCTAAGFSAL